VEKNGEGRYGKFDPEKNGVFRRAKAEADPTKSVDARLQRI
jgi:hypothetical protein